jgi:hypothetical protein
MNCGPKPSNYGPEPPVPVPPCSAWFQSITVTILFVHTICNSQELRFQSFSCLQTLNENKYRHVPSTYRNLLHIPCSVFVWQNDCYIFVCKYFRTLQPKLKNSLEFQMLTISICTKQVYNWRTKMCNEGHMSSLWNRPAPSATTDGSNLLLSQSSCKD